MGKLTLTRKTGQDVYLVYKDFKATVSVVRIEDLEKVVIFTEYLNSGIIQKLYKGEKQAIMTPFGDAYLYITDIKSQSVKLSFDAHKKMNIYRDDIIKIDDRSCLDNNTARTS